MGPPPAPALLQQGGELLRSMWGQRDARALLATSVAMVIYVETVKLLAAHRVCASVTARKLMHMGCGPIFLLCWPLFSDAPNAARYAAAAPLAITLVFALVGLGIVKDEATVRSMSRTGARGELLKGPLLYGAVIVAATLLHWRRLTAALAISCLCSGDGAADIVGRRFGGKIPAPAASKAAPSRPSQPSRLLGQRIPWCPQKSWAGTGGFIVFAAATSLGFARLFQYQGWAAAGQRGGVWARVLGTAAVSAAAETLPVPEGWDNLVVFVAALAADWWVCRRRGLAL